MKFLRTILIFTLFFTIANCNAGKKIEDEAAEGKKVEKEIKNPIVTLLQRQLLILLVLQMEQKNGQILRLRKR